MLKVPVLVQVSLVNDERGCFFDQGRGLLLSLEEIHIILLLLLLLILIILIILVLIY